MGEELRPVGECTKLLACVDETGNFDRTSETHCVGGLLLRASPEPGVQLRTMSRKALPHLHRPPHAAHLNRRSFHLVSWMRLDADRRAEVPPELARPLAEAERLLGGWSDLPDLLRAPCPEPPIKELAACDQWLRGEARKCWSLLEDVHAVVDQRISWLLRGVRDRMGGVLVAAVRMHVPEPATRSGAPPDAFLSLLTLDLERLLLLRQGGRTPVELELQISERDIVSGAKGQREKLTREHVMREVDDVRALGIGAGVTVVMPRAPQPFDAYMPPGLALADLAVNRLRWVMEKSETWSDVVQFAQHHIGLPVELKVPGLGRLPTIAFDGTANEVLRDVLAGRAARGLNELEPLAREQAERWVAALRARRTGEGG